MSSIPVYMLSSAVVALAVIVGVLARRVATIRRRERRSLLVDPLAHLRLQKQVFDRIAALECRMDSLPTRFTPEFRGEWGEDILLYELFFPQRTGVYVEAGAHDGLSISVTRVFEAIGWTGLLVEPVEERWNECRINRPNSVVIRTALGPEGSSGTTRFQVPTDPSEHSRAYREHDDMQPEPARWLEAEGKHLRTIEVPLSTLTRELDAAGFSRVDFVVLDVEGGEFDVLRGFDLERFSPRALLIEDLSLGDDPRVADHLTARGYDPVLWLGLNRLFVRRADTAIVARAARLAELAYSPFVRPPGYFRTSPRDLKKC